MTNKSIQIVSFNVPDPPNFGGVIDVFYKIKALTDIGVKVYLHTYQDDRKKSEYLEQICEKVYYYPRKKKWYYLFSETPFIVKSRMSKAIIENINSINSPILFEGLHTTGILSKLNLTDKKCIVRTHNIEHLYYKGLYKSETNWLRKLFFLIESKKLKYYENILHKVDMLFTISPFEHHYFESFSSKAHYIPVFHRNSKCIEYSNKGSYVLFHGDLRVSDNIKAAQFLIDTFKTLPNYQLVIASSFRNSETIKAIDSINNITFTIIENSEHLDTIFENTRLHIVLSFQKTGIKLKLINTLYQNRYVIVNKLVVEDTGLGSVCEIITDKTDLIQKIKTLFDRDFSEDLILKRQKALLPFDTEQNAKKIIDLL